jgi:hypothetical protein
MRLGGWARAAVLLLGVAACTRAEPAAPTVVAAAAPVAPVVPAEAPWPEFRVPGADFAVSLPKTPVLAKDTAADDGSVSRTYEASRDKLVYLIAYTYSAPTVEEAVPLDGWLDSVRDGIAARMDAKPRDERRFTLGEARGMEVVLDVPESDDGAPYTIRGRFYVRHAATGEPAQDMLYQTLVASDPGRETDTAVVRFLDSFRFIER